MQESANDHGGGVTQAAKRFGGHVGQWLDLSTGINPQAYPLGVVDALAWRRLPDPGAIRALELTAKRFWGAPESCDVIAAPGASALIARLPALAAPGRVDIPGPTYNEHRTAFLAHGWTSVSEPGAVEARVLVHPNNPDGRFHSEGALDGATLAVIDESFCDTAPVRSLIRLATRPGRIILKSFGKFWGLGGLRLGFAFGQPDLIAGLREMTGPWPVSGPAVEIGTRALADRGWAEATRTRLTEDAARLDQMMTGAGLSVEGGTTLFRLYRTRDAQAFMEQLARRHILVRVFPYSKTWVRLGLPGNASEWARLGAAL